MHACDVAKVLCRNRPLETDVLSFQKVLSGSGRARRLRLMGKYIDHRLIARTEPDNTFWDDSTDWNVREEQRSWPNLRYKIDILAIVIMVWALAILIFVMMYPFDLSTSL